MNKPFILDFCVARELEAALELQYDEDLNLNIIKKGNEKVPLVEADINILEVATKTDIKREEDEPNEEVLEFHNVPIIESEQYKRGLSPFLEMLTKTKIQREDDDE
jgi:hypothetical protein